MKEEQYIQNLMNLIKSCEDKIFMLSHQVSQQCISVLSKFYGFETGFLNFLKQ
jgi:hypothetical protein